MTICGWLGGEKHLGEGSEGAERGWSVDVRVRRRTRAVCGRLEEGGARMRSKDCCVNGCRFVAWRGGQAWLRGGMRGRPN